MKRNNLFRGREPCDEVPLLCPCSARTVFAWMPVSTNILEFRHYSHVHHTLRNFEKSKERNAWSIQWVSRKSRKPSTICTNSPCFMWLEDAEQWKAPERFFSALLMKSRNLWWINLLELHGSNSNYQSEPTKNHQKICIARAYPNHIKQNTLVVRVALLGTATSGRPKVFAFGNLVARRIIMNHYHWLHLNSTISEWC